MTLDSYCRDLEAYLCRKNDGHLIRITGPAFECVSRWAENGIPMKVACAGIDRYFERYYRKGPRRRPVRIEFCEADVLDAFDEWRRAVGVAMEQQQDVPARPRVSLSSHIERSIARVTALRASSERTRPIDSALERVARELDQILPESRSARGAARDALLTQLASLDRDLIDAALLAAGAALRAAAEQESLAELAGFRERMAPDAYSQACRTAVERHVRGHFGLPTLTFP